MDLLTDRLSVADWPAGVAPPPADAAFVYKLDNGLLGYTSPAPGPLGIDEENRTADFVISSGSRDRGGDVMNVAGCDLSEFARNPIVLFGHRQGMPGSVEASKPIGTAESPDGKLMVWRDDDKLLARVFFHQDTDEARECWSGVKNRWLRAASIGFDPIGDPVPLPPEPGQRRAGYRFDRFKLLEFSLVVVPMNPDCVRIRGFLDSMEKGGHYVSPRYRKALDFAVTKGEWRESDHPRDESGKFGEGGGGGSASGGGGEQSERAEAATPSSAAAPRHTVQCDDATREKAKKLLGRDEVSDEDLAAFACAPPGTHVRVSHAGGKLYVTGVSAETDENGSPLFTSTRAIYKPWFAPLTCENKTFGLRGGAKGQGAVLFAAQVEALQKAGVGRIVASAAGGPDGGGNGYYTWPRLGYGGPMTSQQISKLPEEIRKALGKKTDVRDLFDLPGGAEAWKKHGSSLTPVIFDLEPGSRNMKALQAYQAEKSKGSEKSWQSPNRKNTTGSSANSTRSSIPTGWNPRSTARPESGSSNSAPNWVSRMTPARSIDPLVARALAPLPLALVDVLDTIKTGLSNGSLTMTTKAFPPKKKDEEEKPGGESERPGTEQQQSPDNAGDRPADGPDLAGVIGNLTTAIVQLQEMVKPKEAAPAAAMPHAEPDGDEVPPSDNGQEDVPPGSQDRSPDTQNKPPVDDPRKRKEEEEEGREAMDRYRRAGFPGVVKGYLRKEHHACMKEASDHLDELSNMGVGEKWTGSHRMACKAHCAAIRKALEESSSSGGGATTVPEEMPMSDGEVKAVALAAVNEAFAPLREGIFRLTGRRA